MWRALVLAVLVTLPLSGISTTRPDQSRQPSLRKLALCFGYGLHAYRRALGEAKDGQTNASGGDVTESANFQLDGAEIEVELHNRFYDTVTVRFPKGKYKAWGEASLAIGLSTDHTKRRDMVGGSLYVTGFENNMTVLWTPVGADIEPDDMRGDETVEMNKGPWDLMKIIIPHNP